MFGAWRWFGEPSPSRKRRTAAVCFWCARLAAHQLLRDQWRSGERDRELGLHLMSLAWYLLMEPEHFTGLDPAKANSGGLTATLNEAHDWLLPLGSESDDAEVLYAAGLMAHLAPWLFGDSATWSDRSEAYRSRHRHLAPKGINPVVFEGRGAYGDYFQGQARVQDGY